MPNLLKIAVKKGSQGFGFILSNQSPCIVSSVIEGSPAEIASLRPGDEVLEVNNQNVSRSTHEQVVRLILKTSGKWVNLKVRRFSDPTDFANEYVDLADDNSEFHNSIIETVDRVVEDLKSGNLFKSPESFPKGKYSTLEEANSSPGQQHEKLNEDSKQNNPDFNSPSTNRNIDSNSPGLRNSLRYHSDSQTGLSKFYTCQPEFTTDGFFKVVVGYLRTIELPSDSSVSSASLDAIKNVAGGLHLTSKKINKRLLMILSLEGIKLISTEGSEITYPLSLLSFTCSCLEDNNFFGIVTRKVLTEDHRIKTNNSRRSSIAQVHSCHIFMVDTDLCLHSKHKQLSEVFGFTCTCENNSETSCKEFPKVSTDILYALNSLLKEKSSTIDLSDPSLDCSTPPMNRKVRHFAFENDLSNSLGMLEKLRIDEELKAQIEAEDEDSDLESPIMEFSAEKTQHPVLEDSMNTVTKSKLRTAGESTAAASHNNNVYMENNLSIHTNAIDDLTGTKDSLFSCPSITDRFEDDAALQLADSTCTTMKENGGPKCLEQLLKSSVGLKSFEDFLKKEHSEENIMFWKACEVFKQSDDPCKLRKMAIEIYHTYLAHGAPGLVNVDQQAVKKAEEKLISPDANMFNLQQQQIFMLMKYDCFPRYLKSEFYQRSLTPDSQDSPEEDLECKEYKKRKTHWYIKKLKVNWKDSAPKEPVDADRKRSLLGILSKSKGQKQESKSKARKPSESPPSENDTRCSTPTLADEVNFYFPKSPMEIKEFLGCSSQFCRVVLPNGSSTVLMPEPGKSIRELLENYCGRQNLPLSSDDVFVDEKNQSVDMDKESLSFGDRVIHLLRKVQFRFDLPSKRSVAVKESPIKTLYEVIEPIMRKNGYKIDNFEIRFAKDRSLVQLGSKLSTIADKHLITVKIAKSDDISNVASKPPAGKGVLKATQSSFEKSRKTSKDDSSLQSHPSLMLKTNKTQDAFNRFIRRGSLEGGLSFIKRKQSLRNSITAKNNNGNLHDIFGHANQSSRKSPEETAPVSKTEKTKDTQTVGTATSESKSKDASRPLSNAQKENIIISKMNIGKFRPASEVFTPITDSFIDDYSEAKSARAKNLNLHTAASDPEIGSLIEKTRSKSPRRFFSRGQSEIAELSKYSSDSTSRKAGRTSGKPDSSKASSGKSQQRKLSKNLLTWRARENSCDSASSSTTDEHDSVNNKRSKRADVNRNSSPPFLNIRTSPQSPRNKHQKVELQGTEIEIANSPIYPVESGGQKSHKPRPAPITGMDESTFLLGLKPDPGGNPDVESNQAEIDDSFELAIENHRGLFKAAEEAASAMHYDDKGEENDAADDENMASSCNNEVIVTATGSVNDETLIMEDKDTGFDLFGLMDMTTARKNRRGAKQKVGDKDARSKADQSITFV